MSESMDANDELRQFGFSSVRASLDASVSILPPFPPVTAYEDDAEEFFEEEQGEGDAGGGSPANGQGANSGAHPLTIFSDPEVESFTAPEFVIDGTIVAGMVVLAGGWGAGKTSQLVPLLFRAAHLCQPDDPLKPLLRRRVVYVTEDAEQVRRIIRSMRIAGELEGISPEEVADYFKIVSAVRMPAREIVKVAEPYSGLVTRNVNRANGVEHDAHALIVFDTRSATIDLDSEDDNTEAGRVVSTLRQGLPDNPMIIVGHVAKALKRSSVVSEMSGRGAGAWEADAQQVLYLINDEGQRWLDVSTGKHRFVPKVDGITFETSENETTAIDPLGNTISMRLIHGKPISVALGKRAAQKAEEQERAAKEALNELRGQILRTAREWQASGVGFNRKKLLDATKGRRENLVQIIEALLDEYWLVELSIPAAARTHPSRSHYLAALSPEERERYGKNGELPEHAKTPPKEYAKP